MSATLVGSAVKARHARGALSILALLIILAIVVPGQALAEPTTASITLRPGATTGIAGSEATLRDSDVRFRLTLTRLPARGVVDVFTTLRSDGEGTEYRIRTRVRPNGVVTLTTYRVTDGVVRRLGGDARVRAFRARAGVPYWVRLRVAGASRTVLRAAMWRDGTREPRGWASIRTDSRKPITNGGTTAVTSRTSAARPRAIVLRIDRFTARAFARTQRLARFRITSVKASELTRTTADITWTLTKHATGQVRYGTSHALGQSTTAERSFRYSTHVQTISGLQPGTRYYFQVTSRDESGRTVTSAIDSFVTDGASGVPAATPRPTAAATPRPTAAATPRPTAAATPRPTAAATPRPTAAATPRPTAAATPRPTAAATPRPTATPTPRPTATPTPPPSGTVRVPSSIDATGSSNVSSAMQSFFSGVPNGSTVQFPSGATYLLGGDGIRISGKRNLVIDGNGATLRSNGCTSNDSLFFVTGSSSGITIRDFVLVGNNDRAGTSEAHVGSCQHQHGIALYGVSDIEVSNVEARRLWGDCLYVGMSGSTWSSGVRYVDSECRLIGRQAVSIVGGRDVRIQRVSFDQIGMNVLDIEPNNGSGGASDVLFANNTVGTYDHTSLYQCFFFGANGSLDARVERVTVRDNTVTGASLLSLVGDEYTGFSGQRNRRNIVFTGNRSTVSRSGPVLTFKHVDGVTVSGNTQPGAGSSLARFVDSTGVDYQP